MIASAVLTTISLVAAGIMWLSLRNQRRATELLRTALNVCTQTMNEQAATIEQQTETIELQAATIRRIHTPGPACCHEVERCRHRDLFPGDAPVQFGQDFGPGETL